MALWFLSTRASRRMSLPDAVRCCRLRTRVPRSLERRQRLQQRGTQHQRLHPGGREQQGLGSPLAAAAAFAAARRGCSLQREPGSRNSRCPPALQQVTPPPGSCFRPRPASVSLPRELSPPAERSSAGASRLVLRRSRSDASERGSTQGNKEMGHRAMATGIPAASQAKIYLLQRVFSLGMGHPALCKWQ